MTEDRQLTKDIFSEMEIHQNEKISEMEKKLEQANLKLQLMRIEQD